MKIEMTFPIPEVKDALNTESELLPSSIRRKAAVLTITISDKYKDVIVLFLKDKLREAYDEAISKGSDEVTLFFEPPSDEDWEERGFVRQGDFMVKKDDVES